MLASIFLFGLIILIILENPFHEKNLGLKINEEMSEIQSLATLHGNGTEPPIIPESKTFSIIFPVAHEFFDQIGKASVEYGKARGWKVMIRAPREDSVEEQIRIVNEMIDLGVDGIAIGPADSDLLIDAINHAIDKNIPVVCFGTDSPKSRRKFYIGSDNYNAGHQMGSIIVKYTNGTGKILILTGLSTQLSLNERIRGIRDYVSLHAPDIDIVEIQSSGGAFSRAVASTETMIRKHPDFKALIGIDATAGPAAASVWKAKGWQNNEQHLILCFDNMEDNLTALRDGFIKSILAQRQELWSAIFLDTLVSISENKDVQTTSQFTGMMEITIENINDHWSGIKAGEQQMSY